MLGLLVAVLGLVLLVGGAWVALWLGPGGEASFRGQVSGARAVVVPPAVVNGLDKLMTVTATRDGGGPVWVGVTTEVDAQAVLGSRARTQVRSVDVTGRGLRMQRQGSGTMPDVSAADVWRHSTTATGRVSLGIPRGPGPQTVVIASGVADGAPVGLSLTLSWAHPAWFYEAVVIALMGAILVVLSAGYVWLQLRSRRAVTGPDTSTETAG